jgi:transcriptional regulator with XRE-family HTH domain
MKNDFYVQVGMRIKCIREKRKYTREYISYKTGISTKFLYEIEYGIKGFSADNLYKISRALDISSEYLLSGCETNDCDSDINETLKTFTEKEREHILIIIREICALYK